MYPRETLVEDVKTMDSMFKEYHKNSSDGLLRTVNVINGLVEIFAEKFEHKYDRKLLRKFANCRTMHRMRWVQRQMKSHHEETLRSKRKKLEHHYNGNPNTSQNNPSLPIPTSTNSQNNTQNPLMFVLLHQLVTKIQKMISNFFVLIFLLIFIVVVAIPKKKIQPCFFSFGITTKIKTNKFGISHFVFSH